MPSRSGSPRSRTTASGCAPAASRSALVLYIRDETGSVPHVYFEWTEGNPLANMLRFLVTGQGEIASLTREVLREAEPHRDRRPRVHVG